MLTYPFKFSLEYLNIKVEIMCHMGHKNDTNFFFFLFQDCLPEEKISYYSLDEGKTKFFDLLQMVEYYQLNQGSLNTKLSHYIVNTKDSPLTTAAALNNAKAAAAASNSSSANSASNPEQAEAVSDATASAATASVTAAPSTCSITKLK